MKKKQKTTVTLLLMALLLLISPTFTMAQDSELTQDNELPKDSELPNYVTEAIVPVTLNNNETSIKLLIDKKEIYPNVIEMMKMAKHEILLNMYLFGGDDNIYAEGPDYIGIGKHVIDIMAEKIATARANGEEFRIRIVAPKPSDMIEKQTEIKNTIKRVRSKLRHLLHMNELPPPIEPPYEPVFDYAVDKEIAILSSNTDVMATPIGASWRLDHSKLLIIDGKEALIGGMNFAECVSSNHDAMTRITGNVVSELKAIFANAWYYSVQQAEHNGLPIDENLKDYDEIAATDPSIIEKHHKLRLNEGWEKGNIKLTLSAPYLRDSRDAVVSLLDSTVKGDSIMLEMLLLTDVPCIEALIRAHKREVDVKVILDPNHSLYGVNCHGAPNIIATKPFLEARLPMRNYSPKDSGQELHMKLLIVKKADGTTTFAMGSTNFTYGAFESNFEMFAFYENCEDTCSKLCETFKDDWDNHTHLPGREVTSTGFLGLKPLSEEERYRKITFLQKFLFIFLEERHEKWF